MPDNFIKVSVFLSWSGYQSISYELARILQKFLPDILQGLEIYFSKTDIGAGVTWLTNLNEHLLTADFAVFCLTQQNLHSQWMHYEAGAVMMHKDRTCPFLFCVNKKSLDSPLNYHQCVEFQRDSDKANQESFKNLLNRLNEICLDKGIGISEKQLNRQFNRIYNRNIKRALIRLSERAKAEETDAQTQAEEIIAQAYAKAKQITEDAEAKAKQITEDAEAKKEEYLKQAQRHLSQTREHYNQALSDVEVHSRTWSVRGFSVKNGNEPFSYKRSSLPDTLEIIMGQGSMPLPVSLGYLEHCLNILSAFPLSILRGHVEEGKDGKPDNGRWEVIKRGRALIDALHGKKQGCDKEQVTDFQRLVKAKLALPYEDDKIPYHNKQYGSPVSIQTVRRALETVIRNILLCLGQERKEPT